MRTVMSKKKEIVGQCPLCKRDLIKGPTINEHHLIPKAENGSETVTLHVVCHSKIHSIWHENDLKDYYHTIERLLSDERIQKFVKWVAKKDPEFIDSNKRIKGRKR